ncbi:hypothetical protein CDIK_3571 [Cucumispora dikerogammari]|nr:hypothetical protein CDIK_3571 [Cucumispora dikerogammari]
MFFKNVICILLFTLNNLIININNTVTGIEASPVYSRSRFTIVYNSIEKTKAFLSSIPYWIYVGIILFLIILIILLSIYIIKYLKRREEKKFLNLLKTINNTNKNNKKDAFQLAIKTTNAINNSNINDNAEESRLSLTQPTHILANNEKISNIPIITSITSNNTDNKVALCLPIKDFENNINAANHINKEQIFIIVFIICNKKQVVQKTALNVNNEELIIKESNSSNKNDNNPYNNNTLNKKPVKVSFINAQTENKNNLSKTNNNKISTRNPSRIGRRKTVICPSMLRKARKKENSDSVEKL